MSGNKTIDMDLWVAILITALVIFATILCILLSSAWTSYKQLCVTLCGMQGERAIVTIGVPMECRCISEKQKPVDWKIDIPLVWDGT